MVSIRWPLGCGPSMLPLFHSAIKGYNEAENLKKEKARSSADLFDQQLWRVRPTASPFPQSPCHVVKSLSYPLLHGATVLLWCLSEIPKWALLCLTHRSAFCPQLIFFSTSFLFFLSSLSQGELRHKRQQWESLVHFSCHLPALSCHVGDLGIIQPGNSNCDKETVLTRSVLN